MNFVKGNYMYSKNSAPYVINEEVGKALVDFLVSEYLQENESYYYTPNYDSFIKLTEDYGIKTGKFEVDWSLGGTYGHYSGSIETASPDLEQELDKLDSFLMHSYPQVTFLQYKMIGKKIKRDTHQDSDYYGGRTTRATKTLYYSDLADALVAIKIVSNKDTVDSNDLVKYLKETYTLDWFNEKFPEAKPKTKSKAKKK